MLAVDTILTWQAADPAALTGHTVVVIDVLRWTTVVTTALEHGAASVEACGTPEEAPERIAGRVVVTSTTNGTQALLAAARASRVVIACFRNLDAVARDLRAYLRAAPITLLCAGRSGEEAVEDTACAGAIAHALRGADPRLVMTGATQRAMEAWHTADGDPGRAISDVAHARALRADGFADDVTFACALSTVSIVPVAVGARITRAPTAV